MVRMTNYFEVALSSEGFDHRPDHRKGCKDNRRVAIFIGDFEDKETSHDDQDKTADIQLAGFPTHDFNRFS